MKKIIHLLVFFIVVLISCSKDKKVEVEPKPISCFSFTEPYIIDGLNGVEYLTPAVFSNCSENSTSYLWDFGDGYISHEPEAEHKYIDQGEYIVSLTAKNSNGSSILIDTLYVNWLSVDKPNIYIYPKERIDICVELSFPQGGHVIKSIPTINNNIWCVNVNPTGRINNTYDYLFFESIQPNIWQHEKGWCVSVDSLEDFFRFNMECYNFKDNEIFDFVEYWIPRLKDYKYYKIYPQTNDIIKNVIELNFSIQPDNVNRLYYAIMGSNEYEEMSIPLIKEINRNGFTVVEWGCIIY